MRCGLGRPRNPRGRTAPRWIIPATNSSKNFRVFRRFSRCFFSLPSDLLDTFGAQLGWLLSPKVSHHPERGANQVELEIIQIRDSKSFNLFDFVQCCNTPAHVFLHSSFRERFAAGHDALKVLCHG